MIRILGMTLVALFAADPASAHRESEVLGLLGLREGMVVADIGCGSGWLSAAVAKEVGPEGKVFAVDISQRKIDTVNNRGIANVTAILSKPHDASLPERSLDIAFLHDVASHVREPVRERFYASVERALKPDGVLVIFLHHGKAKKHLEQITGFGFHPVNESKLAGLTPAELDKVLGAGLRFTYRKRREI